MGLWKAGPTVGFSGHVGGLGLGGLGLGGLDLRGLGLDPSPPSVHIALCLLCFLVSFSSSRQSTSFVSNTDKPPRSNECTIMTDPNHMQTERMTFSTYVARDLHNALCNHRTAKAIALTGCFYGLDHASSLCRGPGPVRHRSGHHRPGRPRFGVCSKSNQIKSNQIKSGHKSFFHRDRLGPGFRNRSPFRSIMRGPVWPGGRQVYWQPCFERTACVFLTRCF
jgi:hypothetical protein